MTETLEASSRQLTALPLQSNRSVARSPTEPRIRPQTLTVDQIAAAMGVDRSELTQMIDMIERFYESPRCEVRRGKSRLIESPIPDLKDRLRSLLKLLRIVYPSHSSSFGGVRGRSTVDAASRHLQRHAIVTRDIQDCYPSITASMLLEALLRRDTNLLTSQVLVGLLIVNGHVPQGSPLSGLALEILFHHSDHRIATAAGRFGLRYTRSHDDLVISASSRDSAAVAQHILDEEIDRTRLRVNKQKKKRRGLQNRAGLQVVHGIVVNSCRNVRATPATRDKLHEESRRYIGACKCLSFASLDEVVLKRKQLMGHFYYLSQFDHKLSRYLRSQIEIGDQVVATRLRRLNVFSTNASWARTAQSDKKLQRVRDRWATFCNVSPTAAGGAPCPS